MYDSSDEAMEVTERVLTVAQVERELRKHCTTLAEMQADLGVRDTYSPFEVLAWLGY